MQIKKGELQEYTKRADKRQEVIDIAKDVFSGYVCRQRGGYIKVYPKNTRFSWWFGPSKSPVVYIKGLRTYNQVFGLSKLMVNTDDLDIIVYDSKLMDAAIRFCKKFEKICRDLSHKGIIYKEFLQ